MRSLLLALAAAAALAAPAAARAFDFQDVAGQARRLASEPYDASDAKLPEELRSLTYDQYRDIRFDMSHALWRGSGSPFEVAFFHPGWFFKRPVRIDQIVDGVVSEVPFDPDFFDYGKNKIDPAKLRKLGGYAGFRVHFAINRPDYKDEVLVFLGASYFRALARGQVYGMSARALAIDTAAPTGEEFPHFRQFWLERPPAGATSLTIYGLLDSKRVTGAYRFVLTPGAKTLVDVKSRLYLRDNIGKLGIAPLTSMFFFGANQPPPREDYRPQVHDSDGLSIHLSTGEWLWRPLVNPKRLLVTSFAAVDPAGFGLMQRDRAFADYEDLEARYERRPSAWVTPTGAWGSGRIELVMIPAPDETHDNIVAYWVPDGPAAAKASYEYDYRVSWESAAASLPPLGWVTQTRAGHGYMQKPDDTLAFVVDFDGPALDALPKGAEVQAVVSSGPNGEIVRTNVYPNAALGGWRMALSFRRKDAGKPVELRAYLEQGGRPITETWSYIVPGS